MGYSLIIGEEVAEVLAAMDDTTHELFMLAMLDIGANPHGYGRIIQTDGALIDRALDLASMGLIAYQVDDSAGVVRIASIIWVG